MNLNDLSNVLEVSLSTGFQSSNEQITIHNLQLKMPFLQIILQRKYENCESNCFSNRLCQQFNILRKYKNTNKMCLTYLFYLTFVII